MKCLNGWKKALKALIKQCESAAQYKSTGYRLSASGKSPLYPRFDLVLLYWSHSSWWLASTTDLGLLRLQKRKEEDNLSLYVYNDTVIQHRRLSTKAREM